MYLLAYKPADAPPASKPPGLKTSAASPAPPLPPKEGICATPFLNSPATLNPTVVRFTALGFSKTFGKPTKVYAKTVSLVMVGLNTWVTEPVTESDRFLPCTGVG